MTDYKFDQNTPEGRFLWDSLEKHSLDFSLKSATLAQKESFYEKLLEITPSNNLEQFAYFLITYIKSAPHSQDNLELILWCFVEQERLSPENLIKVLDIISPDLKKQVSDFR